MTDKEDKNAEVVIEWLGQKIRESQDRMPRFIVHPVRGFILASDIGEEEDD